MMGQGSEVPVEKKEGAAKPKVTFSGKDYFLSDELESVGIIMVNYYFLKSEDPMSKFLSLNQRFVTTKDDAKTVATKMKTSFEKRGKVTLVDDVVPNVTGMVVTESKESSSRVTISIYEQAETRKGVFVKTYDLFAPKMPEEKLEKIVKELQKKTLIDLANTKFPKLVLSEKVEEKK